MSTAKKVTDVVREGMDIGSHIHSGISAFKTFFGVSGSGDADSNKEGLQAHHKGTGQVDERLHMSACSRAELRLVKEHALHPHDARRRIKDIVKEVNYLDPIPRSKVILTIGLEQTAVEREIPQGKDSRGNSKPPIKEKVLQNIDGQDIIMMMALHDDRNFTRSCLKTMSTSTELFDFRVNQLLDKVDDYLKLMRTKHGTLPTQPSLAERQKKSGLNPFSTLFS